MGKSSINSHAKKSDKETQSPMLKIFKEIMQRENSDLEKTTLVKDKRKTKKKKQYSSIRSTPKTDQRSECSEPARQDTQTTVKEINKKFSERYTHSSGPTLQNFEKKDSWWVWKEQQKDVPDIKNASTNCSCASCQLKKIISHEYACIGCLFCFIALSVLIAIMLLYNYRSMHASEGDKGMPKCGSTTCHSSPTASGSSATKHTESGHKKTDLSRAIRRSIGDQLMLGKDSGMIGLSEPDFCLDNNFQDIDRLVQASESRNDLASILDPNKFNDAQVSPRLKDFYKKLIETDAQIKNLKKGMYDSATINLNYGGKKNFYRLKRSAARHNRNKAELGKTQEKRDIKDGDPMIYQGATTVLLPDSKFSRDFDEMTKEGTEKGNKRKKRLDAETESSILMEQKQLFLQYVDPSKVALPTFPKCSHIAKNNMNDKLTLIETEKTKKFDDMFDHFIDNNWYSVNMKMKMHDAILDELRKSLDPVLMVDDDQETNDNKIIQFSNKPKSNADKEDGAVGNFEDRLNKYQDKLRKFEKKLRRKQDKPQKCLDKKQKPKTICDSENKKEISIKKKVKIKKNKPQDSESKNQKFFKIIEIDKDDDEPVYCNEKIQISNGIGGISPIGQNTCNDENNALYKKHLKHRSQQKHHHDLKNDYEVHNSHKKKQEKSLFSHSVQDNCDDNNDSQNKKLSEHKNDKNGHDRSNDDQRDKRCKKKNDYNNQDHSGYDDGLTVMKKKRDDRGQDYSVDMLKVGPSGGDDLIYPKLNHHLSCNYHNCKKKPFVQKSQGDYRGNIQNDYSYDDNLKKKPCDYKSHYPREPYNDKALPYKESSDEYPESQKEPDDKPLPHREPYEDESKDESSEDRRCDDEPKKKPGDDEPKKELCDDEPKKAPCDDEPKKAPCDDEPKKAPSDDEPKKTPCDDEPKKKPVDDEPKKAPCDDEPKKEPCDNEPKKKPVDDEPKKAPCDDEPKKEPCDDEPQKEPQENRKESCIDKPKTEPSDVSPQDKPKEELFNEEDSDDKTKKEPCDEEQRDKNPKKEPCDEKQRDGKPKEEPCDEEQPEKPKKGPCDDKPNEQGNDKSADSAQRYSDNTPKSKLPIPICPEQPATPKSQCECETTLSSIMKDVTRKLKDMTRYIKNKHRLLKEKAKQKQKENIKFKNESCSVHPVIKRDMNTAYHHQTRIPAPYDVVVSLYPRKTGTLSPPKHMSRLLSRRLMQTNDYEVEDVGYEDLKEVLSDDKDSHDEIDRQLDRKRRNLPDNHFEDLENSIKGISSETSKDTTIIAPVKMMNKYHPLGMNNQNSKDPMPLYPDELSAYVKNWVDETTVPIQKLEYDKVDHSGSYSDASDEEYPEGFHHYDIEGKQVSFAQAYSDYGVINAKKLQTENTKKDDKRVKLSDKKEKNLGASEGILVQYKTDGDRDDDPKELIKMLQKHLRFSKPKPKTNNKYVSHTTLVPMNPEFDIVYNPVSHLMIKEKKKQRYPEYGYGVGKSLRSLKSIYYDYLDDDSANSDETIDISPIYRGFADLSTPGYVTSEELLYDPSEDVGKTTKDTFPNIFLVTTETIRNVFRNKKYIRSRDIHWGNITVDVTHCIGKKVGNAKPENPSYKYEEHEVGKPGNDECAKKFKSFQPKIDNQTESVKIEDKASKLKKIKKVDQVKSLSGNKFKIETDINKALKPSIDKTTINKKVNVNKLPKTTIQDQITFKLDPDIEKILRNDTLVKEKSVKPMKSGTKNSKALKIKISKNKDMKAVVENDEPRKATQKNADVLHEKAVKAEMKNDKALTAETQKEKALTEKLANVSDAAERLANDFKSAVDALKKATAEMSKNSADQLVDSKSFLAMLGRWFKDLERVTPADKKLGTTEAFSTPYNQTTRVLYPIDHPISYTRTFNRHSLQENHLMNVSDMMFYPIYDADPDVGYKSRLLMSYYDDEHTNVSTDLNSDQLGSSSGASTEPMENLLQMYNITHVPDIPSVPVIISPPEPEKPENKTVVKRSAVGSNLVFWNDIYDDEYGIKTDPVENRMKGKGVNNDLMKKSSLWLQEKMKRMSDSIKRKSKDSFNNIYGKRDSRSSNQHDRNLSDKPMMKSSEDFHSLKKRDSLKTLAMHMNVSDLSAHIRGVCRKAAQEVHKTKSSNDSENTVENAVSTTLMQKLVQLMSELVDYQVQQKTCIKLPEDLKNFLEWLTVMGPTKPTNMGTDNSQSKENPIHLEGGIDLATTPSSEREEHDARSECLGTLHAVENLMNEYSHLSDEDKNKMIGVKEYLEDQLEFLTKQLSSIDDLSLANIYGRALMPFRYRRDHNHNMRKRNAHSPTKRRRNRRKSGRFFKNYSRKHTKTTPTSEESLQVSTEMFKHQNIETPKNKEHLKQDLSLEKSGLAAEVKKREIDFFSEPENITKRNLQDVYYKALEDAKKTTKISIQKKVLDQYDKTVTDSVKT